MATSPAPSVRPASKSLPGRQAKKVRNTDPRMGGVHNAMLTRIALPLAKPILSTMIVLQILNVWNEFIWPTVGSPTRRATRRS